MNTTERERDICDTLLQTTALRLLNQHEMPLGMVVDRMLTLCGAWVVIDQNTKAEAAAIFRQIADAIEAGVYDKVTGAKQ